MWRESIEWDRGEEWANSMGELRRTAKTMKTQRMPHTPLRGGITTTYDFFWYD